MEPFKRLLNSHNIFILLFISTLVCSCMGTSKDKLDELNCYLKYKLHNDSVELIHFSKLHIRDDYIKPYIIHAKIKTSTSYYHRILNKAHYKKCNSLFIEDCFFMNGDKYDINLAKEYAWFDFSPNDSVYEDISDQSGCKVKLLHKDDFIYFQVECIDFSE